ncbi:MAG: hypothetical protein CTY21_14395 [Methylomonas sp.]|nr:MAG: hypothetical protein CTY21_14395 [Methylomonas sp.]
MTNMNTQTCHTPAADQTWAEMDGYPHAAIEGGTMLRIRTNLDAYQGVYRSRGHELNLLTDRGWVTLNQITTHLVQGPNDTDRAGATAELKAYAAFLYQGRLKRPISAADLGHPQAGTGNFSAAEQNYALKAKG